MFWKMCCGDIGGLEGPHTQETLHMARISEQTLGYDLVYKVTHQSWNWCKANTGILHANLQLHSTLIICRTILKWQKSWDKTISIQFIIIVTSHDEQSFPSSVLTQKQSLFTRATRHRVLKCTRFVCLFGFFRFPILHFGWWLVRGLFVVADHVWSTVGSWRRCRRAMCSLLAYLVSMNCLLGRSYQSIGHIKSN